jgi:hypothetical protein
LSIGAVDKLSTRDGITGIICKSKVSYIDADPLIGGGAVREGVKVRGGSRSHSEASPKSYIPIGAHIDFGVGIPVVGKGKR